MSPKLRKWSGSVALVSAMLGILGCAPLGPALADASIPGDRASTVQGEVRSVNSRSEQIQLRRNDGRTMNVRYDSRTTVVYGRSSYPVQALEAGDLVSIRLVQGRGNQVWADRIEVRESVRDRARGHDRGRDRARAAARVQRVDGTVAWVDARRGSFSVASGRNQSVVVLVPHNLSRNDQRRFERLRRGERVRADVRSIGRDQFELVRFR